MLDTFASVGQNRYLERGKALLLVAYGPLIIFWFAAYLDLNMNKNIVFLLGQLLVLLATVSFLFSPIIFLNLCVWAPARMISAGIDRSLIYVLAFLFLGQMLLSISILPFVPTSMGTNPLDLALHLTGVSSFTFSRPPVLNACLFSLIVTLACLPDMPCSDRRYGLLGSAWVKTLVGVLAFTYIERFVRVRFPASSFPEVAVALGVLSWVAIAVVVLSSVWLVYTSRTERER
jgi:hypothetical protein